MADSELPLRGWADAEASDGHCCLEQAVYATSLYVQLRNAPDLVNQYCIVVRTIILIGFVLLLSSCKEANLGPDLSGRIEGAVFDFETRTALSGVGITSSPPTSAIVTDENGTFVLDEIEATNYTITASRSGYQTNSVTVSVQENRTTQAVIFLQSADSIEEGAALNAEVLNWSNRVADDGVVTVRVEYRVRNTGTVDISSYEVYFRIETSDGNFFQEQSDTDLGVGQEDIREFEKELLDLRATDVVIEDSSFEEP